MFPDWLHSLAIFWLSSALLSAIIIYADITFNRPQPMKIMLLAWSINALYFSMIALIAYFWFGRAKLTANVMDNCHMEGMGSMSGMKMPEDEKAPMSESMSVSHITWKGIFTVSTHCGAGCTLADIIGEFIVFFIPVTLMGSTVLGSWGLDFVLALFLGIFFQYLPGREMGLPPKMALKKAIQADILSLISWQIGMYIWMAIVLFGIFTPSMPRDSVVYWFMMQIAMIFGFMLAYPVNGLLCQKGIKHVM